MFIPIADHQVNPFDGGQFLRRNLGMAAGNHDPGSRIRPNGLSNRLTALHGRLGCNRTGIDDNYFGVTAFHHR